MYKQKECISKSESSGAKNFSVWLTVKSKASEDSFPECLPSIIETIITRWGKLPFMGCMALVNILKLYVPCLLIYKNEVKILILWGSFKCEGRYMVMIIKLSKVTPFPGFFLALPQVTLLCHIHSFFHSAYMHWEPTMHWALLWLGRGNKREDRIWWIPWERWKNL